MRSRISASDTLEQEKFQQHTSSDMLMPQSGFKFKKFIQIILLSICHTGTLYLLQIENAIFYKFDEDQSVILHLMMHQVFVYMYSFVLSFIPFYFLGSNFAQSIILLANAFCVCEQVAFKLNRVHTRPSMSEQQVNMRTSAILLGSFISELDAIFWWNLCWIASLSLLLKKWIAEINSTGKRKAEAGLLRVKRSKIRCSIWTLTIFWIVMCISNLSYFLVLKVLLPFGRDVRFEVHPIGVFVSDLLVSPLYTSEYLYRISGKRQHEKNSMFNPILVDEPIFGKQHVSFKEQTWLAKFCDGVTARTKRGRQLVVVSIILESVGATNIFPHSDGVFESHLTPTLKSLQDHGAVVFTSHHDVYPSTTRTHVPMFTGGPSMTMGSLSNQLSHSYQGPTLVTWLKKYGFRTGLFAASDLRFESLATWYKNMKFDKFHHFGNAMEEFRNTNYLNSWGGNDVSIYKLAIKWIEEELIASRSPKLRSPIYVHLLPDATHHPYSSPKSFRQKIPEKLSSSSQEEARYLRKSASLILRGSRDGCHCLLHNFSVSLGRGKHSLSRTISSNARLQFDGRNKLLRTGTERKASG